jgi:hypothetical protein
VAQWGCCGREMTCWLSGDVKAHFGYAVVQLGMWWLSGDVEAQ